MSVIEDESSNRSALNPLHRLLLDVMKDESIIALNRPLLTEPKGSDGYESALQACLSSSRSIIKALASHVEGTPLIWPSFTWAAWMSGFIILYATVEGHIPTNVGLS